MFFSLKLRLESALEKSSIIDQTRPRPSVLLSMIATERWRKILHRDDPVTNDGRENGQCAELFTDTREKDTEFVLGSAVQTRNVTMCQHEFVKSCFLNLRGIVSSQCVVCKSRIWQFWKTHSCVGE